MNSKILGNKLGFKPGASKMEAELEKLKKENAAFKKTSEELLKSNGKLSDVERNRLLEKILALETQKEKSGQEISRKNEEITKLKETLKCKNNGNSFIAAMEEKAIENEKITEELRIQLTKVTKRCKELESKTTQQSSQDTIGNVQILEGQLKDALEKNQQWLVYDQQRETYVKGMMSRIYELEQQLGSANLTLSKQAKDSSFDVQQEEMQKYYDRHLLAAKKDLEGEKKITVQLNEELSSLRHKYEDKKKEVAELSMALQTQHEEKQSRGDERRRIQEKMQRIKMELELSHQKLDEEKQRSAQLSNQVKVMQNSFLKQQEDQKRMASLEQQIQRCTLDFENEKVDRQNVQHQLNKVLKELRKTREQMTRLEPQDVQICTLMWPTVQEEIVWDISFIVLDFLIPGLSIVISYTKIFKITKAMRERLITSTAYSENHQLRVSQRDYKLFRTLFFLMVSFFVMWTPVAIIVLLLLAQNLKAEYKIPPNVFFWIMTFTFSNSIINPILYNINLFKQKWCQIIFCCSSEESVDTDTTTKKNENPNLSTVNK